MTRKRRVSASEKEHNRLMRNVQAKIRRVKQNYNIDLSNEINIPDFTETTTTKERNELKDEMRSFTNRHNTRYQFVKNKAGVVASKEEINKIDRDSKRARRRTIEHLVERGALKPSEVAGLSDDTIAERYPHRNVGGVDIPDKFDFENYSRKSFLKRRADKLEERASKEYYVDLIDSMQDNFIRRIGEVFNEEGDGVIKTLEGLSSDEFYDLYKNTDLDFEEFYIAESSVDTDGSPELERIKQNVDSYFKSQQLKNELKNI